MSLQVFLQAKLIGAEQFLSSPPPSEADALADFQGRCAWLNLLCEVVPRALLSELQLSKLLLGSSSAEQFFLVLGEEDLPRAADFLERANQSIQNVTNGAVRLLWASTENLGAWPIARKRLDDALLAGDVTPLAKADVPAFFAPFAAEEAPQSSTYFTEFGRKLPEAQRIGWSADTPGVLEWDAGRFSWALTEQPADEDDTILLPRRFSRTEDGTVIPSLAEIARAADGTCTWGILRGDIDQFEAQLRRAGSIEEHLHLSAMVKRFIAGELAFLCTAPEFGRKITILHRGGDDFSVLGFWDALIPLARELHRVFETFAEENLKQYVGVEGKTLSVVVEIAPDASASLSSVFAEAGSKLRQLKINEPGNLHAFDKTLEWKRLDDADELKTSLVRLVREFRVPRDVVDELASVYRESFSSRASNRGRSQRVEKPWRTYMRVSTVIPSTRNKEFTNLRNTVITHLIGRKTAGMKLRPSARIGLEWARFAVP